MEKFGKLTLTFYLQSGAMDRCPKNFGKWLEKCPQSRIIYLAVASDRKRSQAISKPADFKPGIRREASEASGESIG